MAIHIYICLYREKEKKTARLFFIFLVIVNATFPIMHSMLSLFFMLSLFYENRREKMSLYIASSHAVKQNTAFSLFRHRVLQVELDFRTQAIGWYWISSSAGWNVISIIAYPHLSGRIFAHTCVKKAKVFLTLK